MKTLNPVYAAALLLLLGGSCTKLGEIIPVPPPVGVIQSLEQTPFKSDTDSLFALNATGTILTRQAVALVGASGQDNGQAVIGYAFRSSAAGAVTSLGVLLPETGYKHTVTLWDSATGQLLAQTDVPTLNGGKWTYVSLALMNQAVAIQPDHGYIVAFNSLATVNQVNTLAPGNGIYILDGIYTQGGGGPKLPVIPFTHGPITFENYYQINYDTPVGSPIFPGTASGHGGPLFDVPGVCDIGFIPIQ